MNHRAGRVSAAIRRQTLIVGAVLFASAISARLLSEGWDIANNPARIDGRFEYALAKLPLSGFAKKPTQQPKPAPDARKTGGPSSNPQPGIDGYGRYQEAEARDVNPGAMHVILGNMIGLRDTGVTVDRNMGAEVWNAPVVGYRVTNAVNGRLREISRDEAVRLLGLKTEWTELIPSTEVAKGVWKFGTFKPKTNGDFVFQMAGSPEAELYLRRGEAPSAAKSDARARGNAAVKEARLSAKMGETIHWGVCSPAKAISFKLAVGDPKQVPAYLYNSVAVHFYFVKIQLDFGAYLLEEKPKKPVVPVRGQDNYEYVLEADASGKAIGGEWTGSSKTKHPDFLWQPAGTQPAKIEK